VKRSLKQPVPRQPGGAAYEKHARVVGDYATAAAAVCIETSGRVHAVIGACGPTPISDADASAWGASITSCSENSRD